MYPDLYKIKKENVVIFVISNTRYPNVEYFNRVFQIDVNYYLELISKKYVKENS